MWQQTTKVACILKPRKDLLFHSTSLLIRSDVAKNYKYKICINTNLLIKKIWWQCGVVISSSDGTKKSFSVFFLLLSWLSISDACCHGYPWHLFSWKCKSTVTGSFLFSIFLAASDLPKEVRAISCSSWHFSCHCLSLSLTLSLPLADGAKGESHIIHRFPKVYKWAG